MPNRRSWTPTRAWSLCTLLIATVACGPAELDCAEPADCPPQTDDSDPPIPFALTTPAFDDGADIPLRYECGGAVIQGPGDNISPALEWTAGPAGTESYAIVMDDVDSGVVHWVIYDIPPQVFDLPEDVPAAYELLDPAGAHQAELQGSGYFGYFGPCSEFSVNTYRWTLHAIGSERLPDATRQTTEYEMVPLIEAASLDAVSFTGES